MGDSHAKALRKWFILPLLAVVIIMAIVVIATIPDDNLHISFLDVGQGDAILIQKGSQQILIDGGPSPQAISLELSSEIPFWDRSIDLVILTHPQSDHITGLVEVLNKYQVEQVLYPDLDCDLAIYDEWLRLIEEKDIESTIACAGQQIDLDGVLIEVLNPQENLFTGTESNIDNNSVVLHVSIGEISFLLTADLMWQAELALINERAIPESTILKVAHHGSATSTTPEFLNVVNPQLAVISVGEDNDYGHPSDEVIDRLEAKLSPENIYRTDEDGTIEFITDGETLWVDVER
jgi:competence protein ComEC